MEDEEIERKARVAAYYINYDSEAMRFLVVKTSDGWKTNVLTGVMQQVPASWLAEKYDIIKAACPDAIKCIERIFRKDPEAK